MDKRAASASWRDIGFVFQDPMTSLNPTMRVRAQIEEVFIGRAGVSKKEVKEKALEIYEAGRNL